MLRSPMVVLLGAVALWGCGGGEGDTASADSTMRDLSLAPAESVAALNDRPQAATTQSQRSTTPSRPQAAAPSRPTTRTPPAPLALAAGTELELTATDTITSRRNKAGDVVYATSAEAIRDSRGRVVVPAGAVFTGEIVEIKPAGSPGGQGTLRLAFNRVSFGGNTYAAAAESDSLGTETQGRGVTGGDAAKVGVGAAAGAVAGRIIGKNTKGAVIGGVVGAAAGAGVAAATKDQDIVLPAGGLIRLRLSQELVLRPVA